MSLFLYCPHLVTIFVGTITVHYYALLNLNLREPWGIEHFLQPRPPYGIRYHSQLGMLTSLSSHLRRNLRPIYSPEFLQSNSCNTFFFFFFFFTHLYLYMFAYKFYFYIYIYFIYYFYCTIVISVVLLLLVCK